MSEAVTRAEFLQVLAAMEQEWGHAPVPVDRILEVADYITHLEAVLKKPHQSGASLAERLLRLADGHYSFDDDDTTPRDDPTPSQYDAMVVEHQKAAREAAARITHLEAVVAAWREREDAGRVFIESDNRDDEDAALARREKAIIALVELEQIGPPQEGCYLKLKEPTT